MLGKKSSNLAGPTGLRLWLGRDRVAHGMGVAGKWGQVRARVREREGDGPRGIGLKGIGMGRSRRKSAHGDFPEI